jgi:hypothetical protein
MPRRVVIHSVSFWLKWPQFKRLPQAILDGFSEWQRAIYPQVIAKCPVYEGPDPRQRRGFVKSHIKIVTVKLGKRHYDAIGVPGASNIGSPSWRAFMVIQLFHRRDMPRQKGGLVIVPKRKQALAFPLARKEIVKPPERRAPSISATYEKKRGPRMWIVVARVQQTGWRAFNPFVYYVAQANIGKLIQILKKKKRGVAKLVRKVHIRAA